MEFHPVTQPCTEALTCGAGELDDDCALGEGVTPVSGRDLPREPGADGTVDVSDRVGELDRLLTSDRLLAVRHQANREARQREWPVTLMDLSTLRCDQHGGQIGRERVLRVDRAQQVRPTHQVGDRAGTE